ncbi:MAG TPA: type II toxin-antitoxin system death-on-curing family toxin [Patescibacteria group bacterium]|nr:type II toxin-antitoxin system death-on-curing family toxin [Patescibacteria group bacterium]
MKYLTTAQVLAVHDQMVKRFGGSLDVRDLGLIESAVNRPQSTFDNEDLYPDIFLKAASLMHSLLKNHAFVDGKKRTAYSSCGVFFKINGYQLNNMHQENLEFTMNIENNSISLEEIASWLRKHTEKTK